MGKDKHVVPHGKDWAVKPEGAKSPTSIHPTQSDAIDKARDQAQRDKSEVVIHRRDGTIRDKDSYGNDPNPPKDRKH